MTERNIQTAYRALDCASITPRDAQVLLDQGFWGGGEEFVELERQALTAIAGVPHLTVRELFDLIGWPSSTAPDGSYQIHTRAADGWQTDARRYQIADCVLRWVGDSSGWTWEGTHPVSAPGQWAVLMLCGYGDHRADHVRLSALQCTPTTSRGWLPF